MQQYRWPNNSYKVKLYPIYEDMIPSWCGCKISFFMIIILHETKIENIGISLHKLFIVMAFLMCISRYLCMSRHISQIECMACYYILIFRDALIP